MAAGGQGEEEQEPMDFELGGLDIDAALFAEPEAHVRPEPTEDHGDNRACSCDSPQSYPALSRGRGQT